MCLARTIMKRAKYDSEQVRKVEISGERIFSHSLQTRHIQFNSIQWRQLWSVVPWTRRISLEGVARGPSEYAQRNAGHQPPRISHVVMAAVVVAVVVAVAVVTAAVRERCAAHRPLGTRK